MYATITCALFMCWCLLCLFDRFRFMHIQVKFMNKSLSMAIPTTSQMTVIEDLKILVEKTFQIKPENQILYYAGKTSQCCLFCSVVILPFPMTYDTRPLFPYRACVDNAVLKLKKKPLGEYWLFWRDHRVYVCRIENDDYESILYSNETRAPRTTRIFVPRACLCVSK